MQTTPLSRAVLLLLTLLALAITPAAASEEVPWGEDINAALKQALAQNKPVLVDVWAIWCVPCAEMDKTTYRDPKVLKAALDFVPVKVDADVQKIFIERYRIDAYPTVLVLDGKGQEITRLMGLVSTEDLLDLLARTHAGYDEYLAAKADRKNPEALIKLARFYSGAGNAEEACSSFRSALKKLKKAAPAERHQIQLEHARSMIDADRASAAIKALRQLAESAATPEIQGQALKTWAEAEKIRGHEDKAAALEARLASEFPNL